MTFLSTTKNTAVNRTTIDIDISLVDIGSHIEGVIQVTLAATKNIAILHSNDRIDRTLNANRSSIDGYGRNASVFYRYDQSVLGGCLANIAILRAAINAPKHMTSLNKDIGDDTNMAGILVLKQTSATTKHIS